MLEGMVALVQDLFLFDAIVSVQLLNNLLELVLIAHRLGDADGYLFGPGIDLFRLRLIT